MQQEGLFVADDFKPEVPDGTPLNEAVSSLIKELRRGNELEATYWAFQIEANFYKYLWRRLYIFAAEDVGLANPDAIVQIRALAEAYMTIRKESRKNRPDGNLITMAVLVLARSQKNREADHLKNVEHILRKLYGWMASVPDYAIDAHTEKGRKKWDKEDRNRMWMLEWSKVDPEIGPFDWQLWMLRRLVTLGELESDFVEEIADKWESQGQLLYGKEGYPDVQP